MGKSTTTPAQRVDRKVVVRRVFNVPRALVFEAWSTAEHMKHWFGPSGFTLPTCEVDFRVGGKVIVCMHSPDGQDFWSTGTFREIVAPERIVMASALMDENDRPRFETVTAVTFEEHDGKTVVTVAASVATLYDPTAAGAIDGMETGWKQTLDRLATHLADGTEGTSR